MMSRGGSVQARAKAWWAGLPLATRAVFALCTGLFLAGALLGSDARSICCGAWLVVGKGQLWRLLSSAFFHAGLLHWGMNMAALASLLPATERAHGTSGAVVMTLCYAAASQMLGIIPATVLYGVTGVESLFGIIAWRECSLGLSGVLFALLTLESTTDDTGLLQRHRILCGVVIPASSYPFVLLVLLQLIMPHVSFMGHLGGILSAHLINPLRLRGAIAAVEGICPQRVKSADAFVPANRVPLPYAPPESAALRGGMQWLSRWLQPAASQAPAAAAAGGGEQRFPGKGRSLAQPQAERSPQQSARGDAVLRSSSGVADGDATTPSPGGPRDGPGAASEV
eukprot:TRINITY_DN4755_c3_g4_i1.p1 TRINITY_DN4755_c3_g4~~TRINITY_DN4755_c3_g4_i1.p1  ORF type:complete len:374 (+),score=96.33 TRINITY_DN4755_c3_g4_i1:105-1124(+)